jgi:apoptosis-inducing factor 3
MSGEQQLSGPDFTQGIAPADLHDGRPLLGHAGGEPVLLVRKGEEIFAIGATCTHYGGPLAEGLVVGDTVRCPWHHACFDLRTGEAVRGPALNPVSCYRVERQDDRIAVREKINAVPQRQASGPDPVVIVGAGAAGNAAAEELRRQGYGGRILLIGPEPDAPYDRPNLSKDYLAGNAPEEWIPLHPFELYEERKIELLLGAEVTTIDPGKKTVSLAGGTVLEFGALILATGAEPIHLDIPGSQRPHVHYLRSLADSRALIAAAEEGKRVVVVGASFIGLEVAAALRTRKLEVTVVAPDDLPLGRILGPELGKFVQSLHEEKGVHFRLGRKPAAFGEKEVELDNGEKLPADLVVVGVGVRPRTALAQQAGLQVENGVLVDEFLETSAPGIFAAGDIARWPDARAGEKIRVEHWVVAERQGQTAARNVLGWKERYNAVPFFWSQHYDLSINYVGHATKWDAIEISGSLAEKSAVATFRSGGKTAAVATIFRDLKSLEAEVAMEEGRI